MDEFRFINMIKQKYYKQPTLIKGVGDDAAVFHQPSKNIVTAVDTFVEQIHFSKETMLPYHIGYRSLAASVSDLVAMGARPTFYLVSIIVPPTKSIDGIKDIFRGMNGFASKYNMDLIGGDTVSGKELALSVTVIGYVDSKYVRYRHIAKDDDIIFVTGTLGNSQAGLYTLQNKVTVENEQYFIKKHRYPNPRVAFGQAMADIKRVSLNDISDGIVNELYEIAEASKVNLIIEDTLVPIHKSLSQFPDSLMKQWVYFGGEDFELVGTAAKSDWEVIKKIGQQTNTKVTKIGYVNNSIDTKRGNVYLKTNQDIKKLKKEGYIHLK